MTKIFVAAHKPDNYLLKLKDPIYIPIHCGRAIYCGNSEEYLPELGDDTGDNISAKNPHYCELTAMYWVWKNYSSNPDDIVGFNHYRRYFSEPSVNELMSESTIQQFLSTNDFIVNGCPTDIDDIQDEDESVYIQYKRIHIAKDLDNALLGVKTLFPELYPVIEQEVKHHGAMCLCNMFITRWKYFEEYCNFLFSVLEYTEATIDFSDNEHREYNGRALGFLGERLFRPWLKATGHSGKQGPTLDWEAYSGYVWR